MVNQSGYGYREDNTWERELLSFCFVSFGTVCYFHFCKYLHCCIVEVGVIKIYISYIFSDYSIVFSVFEEFKVEPRYTCYKMKRILTKREKAANALKRRDFKPLKNSLQKSDGHALQNCHTMHSAHCAMMILTLATKELQVIMLLKAHYVKIGILWDLPSPPVSESHYCKSKSQVCNKLWDVM